MPKNNFFYTKITGVTFNNENGTSRQVLLAQFSDISEDAPLELTLVREPNNPYDSNAVAIYTGTGEQLGYLNKTTNVTVAPWMDSGEHDVHAYGVLRTGGGNYSFGMNIRIERHPVTMETNQNEPTGTFNDPIPF